MYIELESGLKEFKIKFGNVPLHYSLDEQSGWNPRPFLEYIFNNGLVVSEKELKRNLGDDYVKESIEKFDELLKPEGLLESAIIDGKKIYFLKASYRWEDLASDLMMVTGKVVDKDDVIHRAEELGMFDKASKKDLKKLIKLMTIMDVERFLADFTLKRIEKYLKD